MSIDLRLTIVFTLLWINLHSQVKQPDRRVKSEKEIRYAEAIRNDFVLGLNLSVIHFAGGVGESAFLNVSPYLGLRLNKYLMFGGGGQFAYSALRGGEGTFMGGHLFARAYPFAFIEENNDAWFYFPHDFYVQFQSDLLNYSVRNLNSLGGQKGFLATGYLGLGYATSFSGFGANLSISYNLLNRSDLYTDMFPVIYQAGVSYTFKRDRY